MKVIVKFAGDTYEVDVEPSGTVQLLCDALESQTGVLARKQKLIFKGKVLATTSVVQEAKITDGSKLMLLASDGAQSKGRKAAQQVAHQKAADALQKMKERQAAMKQAAVSASSNKSRLDGWRKTGIVSLQQSNLSAVPEEVLALGAAVRVANLSSNKLTLVQPALVNLVNLQKLYLASNSLTTDSIPWTQLTTLQQLSLLALDNKITDIPDVIGNMTSLTMLSLDNNLIAALPDSIGRLTALQLLRVHCNALTALPAPLGECSQLVELNAAQNRLTELPVQLGSLKKLQFLLLDDNKIKGVPPAVLIGCVCLNTLKLHNNPIHMEQLREIPGFKEYDARRKAKHDKQVDMSVLDTHFDEGADVMQWARWGDAKE